MTCRFGKTLAISIDINANLPFKFLITIDSLIVSPIFGICKLSNFIDFFRRQLGAKLLKDLLLRVLITFSHKLAIVEFRCIGSVLYLGVNPVEKLIILSVFIPVDTLLSGNSKIKVILVNMIHLLFEEVLFRLFIVEVCIRYIQLRISFLSYVMVDAVLQAMHVHRL